MQRVFLTKIVIMLLLFHLLTIFGVSPKPHSFIGGVNLSATTHQTATIGDRNDD
jgi:hypothetical protein